MTGCVLAADTSKALPQACLALTNLPPISLLPHRRKLEEGGQAIMCDAWLRFEREEGRCALLYLQALPG